MTGIDTLTRRLDLAVADPPPGPTPAEHLTRGRRALRRRRQRLVGTATAMVLVTGGAGWAVASGVDDQRQAQITEPVVHLDARGLPRTTADLQLACRGANDNDAPIPFARLWASPGPRLVAQARTPFFVVADFLAAGGDRWAECVVYADSRATIGVSPVEVPDQWLPASYERSLRDNVGGTFFDHGRRWVAEAVTGHVPRVVARVRVVWDDKTTTEARADQGWVGLSHAWRCCADGRWATQPAQPRRIQYLDGSGALLAEDVAPGQKPTPGVPGLGTYPAYVFYGLS